MARTRSSFVRIRGLPWGSEPHDVQDFFYPLRLATEEPTTFISGPGGRRTGEAFVRFENESESEKALGYHKAMMGRRYIEVFPVTEADLEGGFLPSRYQQEGSSRRCCDKVIRCRGLPFSVTVSEVSEFFAEYGVKDDHVTLDVHSVGRYAGSPNGEAWVKFRDEETARRAYQKKNLKCIGTRYVELYLSSETERQQYQAPPLRGKGAWGTTGRIEKKAKPYKTFHKSSGWAETGSVQHKTSGWHKYWVDQDSKGWGRYSTTDAQDTSSPSGHDEDDPDAQARQPASDLHHNSGASTSGSSSNIEEAPAEEACEVAPQEQLAASDSQTTASSSAASGAASETPSDVASEAASDVASDISEFGEATDEDDSCVGVSPTTWYNLPMNVCVLPMAPCVMPLDPCAMLPDQGTMPSDSCAMRADPCALLADPSVMTSDSCAMPSDHCAMLGDGSVMPADSCVMPTDPCVMSSDQWPELPCDSMGYILGGDMNMSYPVYDETFAYMNYGVMPSPYVDVAPCGNSMY